MITQRLNFPDIYKGATYYYHFTWLQPDGVTPVDLTGCAAKAQVRETVDSPTVLLEFSTENGRISIDTSLGKVFFTVSAEDTAALTSSGGVYDLEFYHPNGTVSTPIEGKIKFKGGITR